MPVNSPDSSLKPAKPKLGWLALAAWAVFRPIISLGYWICIAWVWWLPERFALMSFRLFAKYVTGVIFDAWRLKNIRKVFPATTDEEGARLIKAMVEYRAKFSVQIVRATAIPQELYVQRNKIHGREHLDAALAKGRGVMLVCGHYGNFFGTPSILTTQGYPISSVLMSFPSSPLEWLVRRMETRFKMHRIVRGKNNMAREAARVIKRNGIFYVLFDLVPAMVTDSIVPMSFGAATMDFYTGPARLAAHFDVAVVPVITYVTSTFESETFLGPAFPCVRGESSDPAMQMFEQWRSWLEARVAEKPEQWWAWPVIFANERDEPASGKSS